MKHRAIFTVALICAAASVSGQKKTYPQPIIAEKSDIFGYAIDRDKNKLVLNYMYEEANEFDETVGQAIVKFKGHYAVIDLGGSSVLEPIYDDITFVPDYKIYVVRLNGKSGVFDSAGREIHPIKYDNIGPTTDGWYEGEYNGDWVYISPDGRVTSDMSEYLEWRKASKK